MQVQFILPAEAPRMTDSVLALLKKHDSFFITTHLRPDGDAIGSQLALGRFLEKLGKAVTMINSDPPPENLGWLPGIDAIETFEGTAQQLKYIGGADVIIVVDTNGLKRIGKLANPVKHSGALKVLIDHHTEPETWFDEIYLRDTASSAGELVYELITAHDADLIDEEIAQMLYAAILTDTGSFRYSSVTPAVHYIIGDLMERGSIQPEVMYTKLYDTRTLNGLRLLALALGTIELHHDGRVGHMVVSLKMLNKTGASHDDTEGFVSYVHSIDGVQVSLIFIETVSGTKISFRSKGDWHVNKWAQAFGGGGHRNASGAYVREPLDKVIRDVIAAAPRFLDLGEAVETPQTLSADDEAYLSTLLNMKADQ